MACEAVFPETELFRKDILTPTSGTGQIGSFLLRKPDRRFPHSAVGGEESRLSQPVMKKMHRNDALYSVLKNGFPAPRHSNCASVLV